MGELPPLSFGEAIERIQATARALSPLSITRVSLDKALGRTTAETILSAETIPPFDNSSVDGFAIANAETATASASHPLEFPVVGTVVAGDLPPETAAPGAWEIMTGAPFPRGLSSSAKIEEVRVERDARGKIQRIWLKAPLTAGENFRAQGEDFSPGQTVIASGTELCPEQILALAALGTPNIAVYRRVKVAILSTGRELCPPEGLLLPGQIRDATGPYLNSELPRLGVEARSYGNVGDDPKQFLAVMDRILRDAPDVILTTGGVSMGTHDYVTSSVRDLGGQIIFHKVAIRPGKPILFAKFPQGPALFGLPGNPVSTVIGVRFFLEPFLRTLLGRKLEAAAWVPLAASVKKPRGLRCFFKAKVTLGNQGPRVHLVPGQLSFMISPLLASNAWAILPEEVSEVAEGSPISCYPLHAPPSPWGEEEPMA
jgi:molybdopterin molybdotransferase